MNDEKALFEAGCFLPSWTEDIPEQKQNSPLYQFEDKDINVLKQELAEIKERIEQIREKQWNLAQQMTFYIHNFVKE